MLVQLFVLSCISVVILVLFLVGLRLCYRRVRPGEALVISDRGPMRVVFSGALVLPIVQQAERIDTSVKTLDIVPERSELLVTKDSERVSYRARFLLRIDETEESVIHVARALTCRRASDPEALEQLFRPKLVGALRAVAARHTLDDLLRGPELLQQEPGPCSLRISWASPSRTSCWTGWSGPGERSAAVSLDPRATPAYGGAAPAVA